MKSIGTCLAAAIFLLPIAVGATGPERSILQYTHQHWTDESDVPRPIFNLAQDRAGYIWVAGADALYRFDGVHFEKMDVTGSTERQGSATALKVMRNGDIWAFFSVSRRFSVFRAGALREIDGPDLRAGNPVTAIEQTRDGAVWALLPGKGLGVWRYGGGKWRRFGTAEGVPDDYSFSMLVAADGALWIAYYYSIVRLAPGASRFETVRKMTNANGRISQDPAGRIWFSEKHGSYPITGPGGRGPAPAVKFAYPTANPPLPARPMFDRSGNLWLALPFGGIQRVSVPNPSGAASRPGAAARIESFTAHDGLASDIVTGMLEDREGNIWVASERGLDKFRPASIRHEPQLTNPPPMGAKLMTARDGTVYIGEIDAVYRVRPHGSPERIIKAGITNALCEAPDGAIWIFNDGPRVAIWQSGKAPRFIPEPPTDNNYFDCAFDRNGDAWAIAPNTSLYRYHGGRWEAMFGGAVPDKAGASIMIADARKRLIVTWGPQRIDRIDYPERSTIPLGTGAKPPELYALSVSPRGQILAGSSLGMHRFAPGKLQTVTGAQGSQFQGLKGIIQVSDGTLWTLSENVLARTSRADLERAFADRSFHPRSLTLGFDDGLPDRAYNRGGRSLVRGGDGRLWIATLSGTVWMDPAHILRNPSPPPVVIAALTVDGRRYRDPAAMTLPVSPANVQIDYAAMSFANPKRVAFRYKLEGFDANWIDPGVRRQAFYTNLPPGDYRFRVIAANNEGVWNRTGAALDFTIPPTFVQSRWFLVLCLTIAIALLWIAYRLRVVQVERSIRNRLEERLGERERIARELHDTLLQSVQGLILRFQSVANRMAPMERVRTQLDTALQRADDIVAEGRNRVRELRPAEGPIDLQQSLRELAEGAGFHSAARIRIAVEGKPRALDPLVAEEVRRIAGEGLFNAARHAKATALDITIGFQADAFLLRICDNGVGIPADIVAAGGKSGHFGLIGMRERAERIGGTLIIDSRPGAGCTIVLTLPPRLAYRDYRRAEGRFPFLPRLWKGAGHE